MVDVQSLIQYETQRNKYLRNGEELLAKGEYRKASEMFWGVATQTLKALGLLFERNLGTHKQISSFVEELAMETHDPELIKLYDSMEKFHVNFYDEILERGSVVERLEFLREFLEKLDFIGRRRIAEISGESTSKPDSHE